MAREAQNVVVSYPFSGMNVVAARSRQPENTTVDAKNVQLISQTGGRALGGSRSGLSRYMETQVNSSNRIQDLNYATLVTNAAPSTTGLGVRQVVPVAVSAGTIYQLASSGATAASASGARTLSNTALSIFSAELFGRLYFTDGVSYKIWVGSNNTATDWTASAGTLPGTDGTSVPRLIEMWRSRIVLAGLRTDAHNWWMSALGSPLDWDTAPASPSEAQAGEGGVGIVGKIPDIINCMIPYSDDVLVFGCDHSIFIMAGDPMAGGRVDMISDTIGMAFGRPYCMDGQGNIYFMSNRGGVYMMPGGESKPVPLSQDMIAPEIDRIDLNNRSIRMVWNEEAHGFNMFLTPYITR